MTTLVTGAGSGMGRLAALRAAAAGHAVAALDREEDAVTHTVVRSPRSRAYPCDVTDGDETARVVARAEDELGPIEHVVHAAGMCEIGSAVEQPIDSMRRVMEVNYFGTLNLTRAALPYLPAAGGAQ